MLDITETIVPTIEEKDEMLDITETIVPTIEEKDEMLDTINPEESTHLDNTNHKENVDMLDLSELSLGNNENILEEVNLNTIIEPIDDISDLLEPEEKNKEKKDIEVYPHPKNIVDYNDNSTKQKPDLLYLLDKNKYDQIGGGDSSEHIDENYLDSGNYTEYLENYEMFLKENNQKATKSKFSYEETDETIIKKSLKTGKKTTIILPRYKRIEDILKYLDIEINSIVYLLKKKRDDIHGDNKDNFEELRDTYLNLIKYKKMCVKFINNNGSRNIDNEIILKKKIEMKQKMFIITDKLKIVNSTTQNIDETTKLIKEYIEENKILSLDKKIRENKGSNLFWNDIDNSDTDLKYETILVKEPNVRKGVSKPTTKKSKKLKIKNKSPITPNVKKSNVKKPVGWDVDNEGSEYDEIDNEEVDEKETEKKRQEFVEGILGSNDDTDIEDEEIVKKVKGKENKVKKEKAPKPKKLKVKYSPKANTTDASYGDEGWDGPFKDSILHSGKGKQILKIPNVKITSLEQAKEECNKLDECKGITEDSSKQTIKITLRNTENFKSSTDKKSWIKK